MKKQDKKIIDDIEFLSQLMEKNNLKELEISDGKLSYKLKKNQNEIKKVQISKKLQILLVKYLKIKNQKHHLNHHWLELPTLVRSLGQTIH